MSYESIVLPLRIMGVLRLKNVCIQNSNLVNNVNDFIKNSENVLPIGDKENVVVEDFGIKKEKRMNVQSINLTVERGNLIKKIKKDKSVELVEKSYETKPLLR